MEDIFTALGVVFIVVLLIAGLCFAIFGMVALREMHTHPHCPIIIAINDSEKCR